MIKKWADKWVAALRSGEYKQGTGLLARKVGAVGNETIEYCCLGVLCELAGQAAGVERKEATYSVHYDRADAVLPCRVQKFVGMHSVLGSNVNKARIALTELNDGGYTFEQIADIIEADYKDL